MLRLTLERFEIFRDEDGAASEENKLVALEFVVDPATENDWEKRLVEVLLAAFPRSRPTSGGDVKG